MLRHIGRHGHRYLGWLSRSRLLERVAAEQLLQFLAQLEIVTGQLLEEILVRQSAQALVQVVAGALGGSAAGAAAKQYSLGTLGNAIAGAIGGGVIGQLIGAVAGSAAEAWVGNIAGGAVGGAILMILVGVIRRMTSK